MFSISIAAVLILTILVQSISSAAVAAFADTAQPSCNICTIENNANILEQEIIAAIAKNIAEQNSANSQYIQQLLKQQQLAGLENDNNTDIGSSGNAHQRIITQTKEQTIAQAHEKSSSYIPNNIISKSSNNKNNITGLISPAHTSPSTPSRVIINNSNNDNKTSSDVRVPTNNNKAGVYLTDIHILSDNNGTLHVGDNITISATIVNNSPNAIVFSVVSVGVSPSATFDSGVSIVNIPRNPHIGIPSAILYPGQKLTIQIPYGPYQFFKATESEIVHAEITFNYGIQNESRAVSGNYNVTSPYTFYIYK